MLCNNIFYQFLWSYDLDSSNMLLSEQNMNSVWNPLMRKFQTIEFQTPPCNSPVHNMTEHTIVHKILKRWKVHFHTIWIITGFHSTKEWKCTVFVKIYIRIVRLYCLIIEVKKKYLNSDWQCVKVLSFHFSSAHQDTQHSMIIFYIFGTLSSSRDSSCSFSFPLKFYRNVFLISISTLSEKI